MLVYILKSAACLAILFVFFKLFLEKENMHMFKRFYLLGALVFSLIVPALVFTEYVEVAPSSKMLFEEAQPISTSEEIINVPSALEADVLDIAPLLWGVYFLGLFFFGLKFIRNLFQIFRRIRKNPKHKLNRFTQVLLQEKITPHTFFIYIFLNKTKFESKEIPKEVLLHEETHAQQKHSWDVVFVELLQVIFWINPFIYLAKKAIKLNHEFLADQAVLQKNIDETTYKNTLLSYLSPDSEKKYQPLANAINYSSIKKRFTIMKTHTSKKAIFFRSLILLPLLAILLYGFSETRIEQTTLTSDNSSIVNDLNIEIDSNGDLLINNRVVLIDDITDEVARANPSLEPKYLRNYVTANILYDESQVALIEAVQNELHQAGISNVEHISKRTSGILGSEGFKSSIYNGKTLEEAKALRREKVLNHKDNSLSNDETVLEIVWLEIKNENEIWFNDELTKLGDLGKKIAATSAIAESKNRFTAQIYSTGILRSNFVDKITLEVRKAGAKKVQVFTEEYIMPESDYQDEIDITPETVILKAQKVTLEQNTQNISISINKKGQLLIHENLLALEDLKKHLSKINSHLSFEQKQEVIQSKIYVDVDSPKKIIAKVNDILTEYGSATIKVIGNKAILKNQKSSQDGASRKLMAEYNKLAKYYNDMSSDNMRIKKKDVERLEYIYSQMSEKQKADAEPFPDFPEPPPPPEAPEAPVAPKVKNGEKTNIPAPPNAPYLSDVVYAEKVIEETIASQDPYDHSNVKYTIINGEVTTVPSFPHRPRGLKAKSTIPAPPAPPEPKSPLDYVIEMAKKNAVFYLEGKEITSDKAIEIMKKNDNINIDSRASKGKRPVVKLSTRPIEIEN